MKNYETYFRSLIRTPLLILVPSAFSIEIFLWLSNALAGARRLNGRFPVDNQDEGKNLPFSLAVRSFCSFVVMVTSLQCSPIMRKPISLPRKDAPLFPFWMIRAYP